MDCAFFGRPQFYMGNVDLIERKPNLMSAEARGSLWSTPQREGILITDLSRCEPQSAISSMPSRGCWYTVSYETEDGIRGVLLGKEELANPPDVRLPLAARGWHAVYLGIFRGGISVGRPFGDPFALKLKLSDEQLFDTMRPSVTDRPSPNTAVPGSENGIEEFFWRACDLSEQSLTISYPRTSRPTMAQLAFVRLVSMTEDEVEEYHRGLGRPDTRVLAAESDGNSAFYHEGMQTVDDLLEWHEPLRDTDVGKLFLGTGSGGSMWYPTKMGDMIGAGEEVFYSERDRRTVGSLRSYVSRGIDPLKAQVEHVQSMGIEVYLGFRMGGPMASVPPGGEPVPFWRDHPEWRCRDREGNTITRLSMAYPEVRRFYVDLFLELADYGVEGVQPIYTRRAPWVLFEPRVIEDFEREHGVDPRELPEDPQGLGPVFSGGPGSVDYAAGLEYAQDERLERLWAHYMTTFMRELREALDGRRRRDGGRLGIVANVPPNAAHNRAAALDLEAWAREGLVDILVPPTTSYEVTVIDYDYFRKVTEGTSCVYYADVLPRHMSGKEYIEAARRAYKGGAAGLAFWDSDRRTITKSQWNTIRRLGHRQDLEAMAQEPGDYRMHTLKLIEDWYPSGFM